MKKVAFLTLFLVPSFTFAAFNDVSLTTSSVIQIGSYTLNVSGTTAAVQSITVNSGNFSVTLGSGSSITVTSPSQNQLTTDISTGVTNTCNSTTSSVAITGTTGTVTITPTATVCVDGAPTPTPPPTPSGGGTSRSGSSASSRVTPPPVTPTPAAITTCPVGYTCAPKPVSTAIVLSFTRTLDVGQSGADVKALQQYLNAKGFIVAATGPGSKGSETMLFGALTRAALAKFQKANKISPAIGFFGPITKAFINSHP